MYVWLEDCRSVVENRFGFGLDVFFSRVLDAVGTLPPDSFLVLPVIVIMPQVNLFGLRYIALKDLARIVGRA